MRRISYIAFGAAVLFGSFFITLWIIEPNTLKVVVSRSDAERLAAQHISNYSEVANAAANIGLRFSQQLQSHVDDITRINGREVNMVGWLADRAGDATPLHVLVFVDGSMVATAQTKGARPDVTRVMALHSGAEKNVVFSIKFNCGPGLQPVVVGIGANGQYMPLQSMKCP